MNQTFTLEQYVRNTKNYLTSMVDRDGLPYFNIFWTDPAEAAHDWPDFGDVMPRQLQAAIMYRHMTGEELWVEKAWREKVLALLDPDTGLIRRPRTSYCRSTEDMGDQALTLYSLAFAWLDHPDDMLEKALRKMCRSLLEILRGNGTGEHREVFPGFLLKGLMVCARDMNIGEALEAADILVHKTFWELPLFEPENAFRKGGHMHGNLRTLMGAADYALYTGDPVLYSRIDAIYRYVKSVAAEFGFLPEVIGRKGDIVACETCAIMDYIGLAVTLANHGHPEYWGDVEKMVRNHLAESQLRDGSWLVSDPSREDTAQFSWRDIGARMVGGYAGWSSPNHILACLEDLHWGGEELRNKPRAFQNCCGGSGTHGFYIAWKNASVFFGGQLTVNLHIDKRLPQAEIRSRQPYQGRLDITLLKPCGVNVKIPDFTTAEQLHVETQHGPEDVKAWGCMLDLGQRQAGERITVTYPLPSFDRTVLVGVPGGRQYRYNVSWKGDTVVKLDPVDNEYETGYSGLEKKEVPVYFGAKGPQPLYQRAYMRNDDEPEPGIIQIDNGAMNLWTRLVRAD